MLNHLTKVTPITPAAIATQVGSSAISAQHPRALNSAALAHYKLVSHI